MGRWKYPVIITTVAGTVVGVGAVVVKGLFPGSYNEPSQPAPVSNAAEPVPKAPQPAESPSETYSWQSIIGDDFSIRVSREILETFEREFDSNEEDMFLLLANTETGIIDKFTDRFTDKVVDACWAERGFFKYLDEISREHGYFLVGYYHSHPGPKTATRAGDLLSGDDIYGHDDVKNDVIRLLGNGTKEMPFMTRAFVPLDSYLLGEDHPWPKQREKFRSMGLLAKSRYDGEVFDRLLELKIVPVDTTVNPQADDILAQHPPFMEQYEMFMDNARFLELFNRMIREENKDDFPFLDRRTRSRIHVKLRHDGAFSIEISAEAHKWKPYQNWRGFRFEFDEHGVQDVMNGSKLSVLYVQDDIRKLMARSPPSIQKRFDEVTANHRANFPEDLEHGDK
jgi:hypothetical protein